MKSIDFPATKALVWSMGVVALLAQLAQAEQTPAPLQVTAMDARDDAPTWYYFEWMATAPHAPVFRVLDTESSLAAYASQTKAITLKDLVKMHGHPCDGLVTAACALSVGLEILFPDGEIDRTDLCCITNNSPCFGDVAAYLTGGRIRFGTQKIDSTLGNEFILFRRSTDQAVKVSLRDGVFPDELARLETRLRTGSGTAADVIRCQKLGWEFARSLIGQPLSESFRVKVLDGFEWKPDPYPHAGSRGDVILKHGVAPPGGDAAEPASDK